MQLTDCTFTVSGRRKQSREPIGVFLQEYYLEYVPYIDSVYAFVEYSPLYGGRNFIEPELSDNDVHWLYEHDIGLRLPLSNKFVKREDYESSLSLLEKYHRTGNTVIAVSDELAAWIKQDFPEYRLEASVIKEVGNAEDIEKTLELYDALILPASINDDQEFLQSIEQKEKITLFANAGCAYNCPSKICYTYISRMNKNENEPFKCSKDIVPREELGVVEFDLQQLRLLGFRRFKLLRQNREIRTGY